MILTQHYWHMLLLSDYCNYLVKMKRLALIPTEGGSKKLCHEFKGKYAGEDFIVYIDAKTGKEANILKIIHTENGMLVM